jgi:DNA repair exonuclease SbcCD ATPase subunit
MKLVKFKNITIKNFLSFGNEDVTLNFDNGLHVITGVNRDKSDRQNGVGKSGLAESLYFAIFGTTIRELKKDLIHNTFTNGTCSVVLNFDVETETTTQYRIERTLNPTSLKFFKNGEDVTRDSIKNTEDDIHTLISASPSIFENCVIMTLNNTTPFMAKSKVDKRKFIEGIFNLDVFSRMLGFVRDEYNQEKRVYEIELTKMEQCQNNLSALKNQKDSILESRKEKIVKYEGRKKSNIVEKDNLLKDLEREDNFDVSSIKSKIDKLESGLELIDTQIEKIRSDRSMMASTNIQLEKTLKTIGTSKEKCPVCLRSVEEHDKQSIEKEKSKIDDVIKTNTSKIEKYDSAISELQKKKKSIQDAKNTCLDKIREHAITQQKLINIKDRIQQLDVWLSQLDEDIESLKNDKTDIDSLIEPQIKLLESIKDQVEVYRNKMNMLDTVKFIVSEEGVKSYIVNKILELFNSRIAYYLNKMQANCLCFFNEYFEEQIINEKNKICSYFNFSGAERKSIDFACLFAFMDMRKLQGDVSYNVSIYDELFDSCLDEQGVELVINIIKDRVHNYNECALVISHRRESVKAATGNVIFLEKRDGITRRIEQNLFLNE